MQEAQKSSVVPLLKVRSHDCPNPKLVRYGYQKSFSSQLDTQRSTAQYPLHSLQLPSVLFKVFFSHFPLSSSNLLLPTCNHSSFFYPRIYNHFTTNTMDKLLMKAYQNLSSGSNHYLSLLALFRVSYHCLVLLLSKPNKVGDSLY